MRGEQEQLEEASGKLYTKDLVIQDCNAYIKQVYNNFEISHIKTQTLFSILRRITSFGLVENFSENALN